MVNADALFGLNESPMTITPPVTAPSVSANEDMLLLLQICKTHRLSVVGTFVAVGVGCECEKFSSASKTPRSPSQDGRFWRLAYAN
jgi:hypothetical protein